MSTLVRGRSLSRRFGRHWALRSVDIEVKEGEAVALVGPNGAGKSTLLTLLATVLRPTSGTLELFGQPAGKNVESVRARMGYLPHATLLDDALTARENLLYYADLFDVADAHARVEEQLERAALADRADDRVEGFSRGMRQRLTLARSLLHAPQLLLLDEPFTGVDVRSGRDLASRLAAEKEAGRALVLVTHQLERVLDWCDRVLVLHRGRAVEDSPPSIRSAADWSARLAAIAEDRS